MLADRMRMGMNKPSTKDIYNVVQTSSNFVYQRRSHINGSLLHSVNHGFQSFFFRGFFHVYSDGRVVGSLPGYNEYKVFMLTKDFGQVYEIPLSIAPYGGINVVDLGNFVSTDKFFYRASSSSNIEERDVLTGTVVRNITIPAAARSGTRTVYVRSINKSGSILYLSVFDQNIDDESNAVYSPGYSIIDISTTVPTVIKSFTPRSGNNIHAHSHFLITENKTHSYRVLSQSGSNNYVSKNLNSDDSEVFRITHIDGQAIASFGIVGLKGYNNDLYLLAYMSGMGSSLRLGRFNATTGAYISHIIVPSGTGLSIDADGFIYVNKYESGSMFMKLSKDLSLVWEVNIGTVSSNYHAVFSPVGIDS